LPKRSSRNLPYPKIIDPVAPPRGLGATFAHGVIGAAVFCLWVLAGLLAGAVFRLRYRPQSLDQTGRTLHAMGEISKEIDPDADMGLPGKPHGSR
jgi:hypothetical protein